MYRLAVICGVAIVQSYVLEKRKLRRMEREVVAEAERITLEASEKL
jgi:hypothetical protein